MDTKNSVFLAFLTLSAISFSSIFAAQNTNSQIQAPSPTPFPVCIDDSDCVKLGKGDKFACFQVRNLTVFFTNIGYLGCFCDDFANNRVELMTQIASNWVLRGQICVLLSKNLTGFFFKIFF